MTITHRETRSSPKALAKPGRSSPSPSPKRASRQHYRKQHDVRIAALEIIVLVLILFGSGFILGHL